MSTGSAGSTRSTQFWRPRRALPCLRGGLGAQSALMDRSVGKHRRKETPPGDPSVAVAYLRVSTEDQHLGPEAQRESVAAWASARGVAIVQWEEEHISGATPLEDRPGLLRAIEGVSSRRAGLLVVAKRDRLARDVVVAAMIEREAARCGARVVSADGAGNDAGPAGEFMRTIVDGAAAYERAMIRGRTRAALQALRARGQRSGTVPWGFSALEDGALVLNEDEARVARRVKELRAAGQSFRRIVAELKREGVKSRKAKPLSLRQVFAMTRTT